MPTSPRRPAKPLTPPPLQPGDAVTIAVSFKVVAVHIGEDCDGDVTVTLSEPGYEEGQLYAVPISTIRRIEGEVKP